MARGPSQYSGSIQSRIGATTTRRRTIAEARYPNTPEFVAVAVKWHSDASRILLDYVWQAYDLLYKEVLSKADCTKADEDLERTITQLLEQRIHRVMNGVEPFCVQHGPYEEETRKPPPAQPPQYDIAFVLNSNPRVMWPLEAKVLRSDGVVGEYVKDINNEFLTCRYAPFSSEGGMLGYLLSGDPNTVFNNIALKVPCKLSHHPSFQARDHKISDHVRKVPRKKKYPRNFRCHHLVLSCQ